MKTICKHVKRIGESCTLNNECTYPNCNKMNKYKFENNNGSTITIEAKDINFALEMMRGLKAEGYTLTKTKIK